MWHQSDDQISGPNSMCGTLMHTTPEVFPSPPFQPPMSHLVRHMWFMERHMPRPTSRAVWSRALRPRHISRTMYATSPSSTSTASALPKRSCHTTTAIGSHRLTAAAISSSIQQEAPAYLRSENPATASMIFIDFT
jgi:hypothetical protein